VFESLSRAEGNDENFTPDQRHRAAAFAAYMAGDLPGAMREWQVQSDPPATLSQLEMVGECLAAQGDDKAGPYIDKLGEFLPTDADATRAELYWRQHRPEDAVDLLERCIRNLRDHPWVNRDLVTRSLARVELIAGSDRSKVAANLLFEVLGTAFCVFNDENERLAARLAIAIHLEGSAPGEKLRTAVQAFEPHVLWRKEFLQVRNDCYAALHDPGAKQARHDLDEFIRHETATTDVSTLTKKIRDQSTSNSNP